MDWDEIEEKIQELETEYGVSVKYQRWDQKNNWVSIAFGCEGGFIAEKVAEKYAKKIGYYTYSPEDTTEIHEAWHFILYNIPLEIAEEELEKAFKEMKNIQEETKAATEKLNQSILKQAGLLD